MESNVYLEHSQTDYKGNWKLSDLFTQFAIIATNHAISFGGWKSSYKDSYGWIVSKMRVKVYRNVKIEEEVTIRTWVTKGTHVVYPRQFEVYDQKGNLVIEATSNWTLLDLIKRRIAMPKRVGLSFPEDIPEKGNVNIETNFDDEDGFIFVEKRQVRYGDIDVNKHLNNARYIEWMCDILGFEKFNDYLISDISVQFKKETAPGDWLVLEKKEEEDSFKVRFIDEEGQVHFVAEGLWKKY